MCDASSYGDLSIKQFLLHLLKPKQIYHKNAIPLQQTSAQHKEPIIILLKNTKYKLDKQYI